MSSVNLLSIFVLPFLCFRWQVYKDKLTQQRSISLTWTNNPTVLDCSYYKYTVRILFNLFPNMTTKYIASADDVVMTPARIKRFHPSSNNNRLLRISLGNTMDIDRTRSTWWVPWERVKHVLNSFTHPYTQTVVDTPMQSTRLIIGTRNNRKNTRVSPKESYEGTQRMSTNPSALIVSKGLIIISFHHSNSSLINDTRTKHRHISTKFKLS